jgi:hypothetical protein
VRDRMVSSSWFGDAWTFDLEVSLIEYQYPRKQECKPDVKDGFGPCWRDVDQHIEKRSCGC